MNQGEQGDKMTKHQGNAAASEVASLPPRPPSSASTASTSSSTSSSKHVKCIGRYLLTGTTLGKGNFARVEAAVHTLTQAKVWHCLHTQNHLVPYHGNLLLTFYQFIVCSKC